MASSAWTKWSQTAERRVKDVIAAVPDLRRSLEDADFTAHVGTAISDRIDWLLGTWLTVGFWSFDAGDVDEIQSDLQRLKSQLRAANSEVSPVYHRYKRGVETALRERREELLATDQLASSSPWSTTLGSGIEDFEWFVG